jgi:hypothetical protein
MVLVTGLKSRDSVLIVGNNATFPWLKKHVYEVSYVKKTSELNALLKSGAEFDRIFVARENILDSRLVSKVARLVARGGLVCFFSDDQDLREAFSKLVELDYPTANVWNFETNVGPVVVSDTRGNPVWVD